MLKFWLLQAAVTQPGYLYIYLSNENDEVVDVFFDDLTITHHHGPIIQQDDYYPFGLTFNSYQRENSTKNNHLYNGKENQDELGLDWADYGARMYMPEIGRWGVIDPLSEKMSSWSTYAYAYDNPIFFVDYDGMVPGPGDLFASPEAAAKDFGNTYNDNSIKNNREYASSIYEVKKDGKTYYTYTKPRKGGKAGSKPSRAPSKSRVVGYVHSHGAYDNDYDNNEFSESDKIFADVKKRLLFVTTPNGSLKRYDPASGEETVSEDLPSDPNDPDRKNVIDPNGLPSNEPTYRFKDWLNSFSGEGGNPEEKDSNPRINRGRFRPPRLDYGTPESARERENYNKTYYYEEWNIYNLRTVVDCLSGKRPTNEKI